MPDEDAVPEELMGHLGEASRSIRASRRLLVEHAPDEDPGHLRLLARLSEALDATESASGEARCQRGRPAPNYWLRGFREVKRPVR